MCSHVANVEFTALVFLLQMVGSGRGGERGRKEPPLILSLSLSPLTDEKLSLIIKTNRNPSANPEDQPFGEEPRPFSWRRGNKNWLATALWRWAVRRKGANGYGKVRIERLSGERRGGPPPKTQENIRVEFLTENPALSLGGFSREAQMDHLPCHLAGQCFERRSGQEYGTWE